MGHFVIIFYRYTSELVSLALIYNNHTLHIQTIFWSIWSCLFHGFCWVAFLAVWQFGNRLIGVGPLSLGDQSVSLLRGKKTKSWQNLLINILPQLIKEIFRRIIWGLNYKSKYSRSELQPVSNVKNFFFGRNFGKSKNPNCEKKFKMQKIRNYDFFTG